MANIMDPIMPVASIFEILGHYFGLFWRSRCMFRRALGPRNHKDRERLSSANLKDEMTLKRVYGPHKDMVDMAYSCMIHA